MRDPPRGRRRTGPSAPLVAVLLKAGAREQIVLDARHHIAFFVFIIIIVVIINFP